MSKSQELLKREIMHFLGDTLALLGAEESFVRIFKRYEELPLTEELIDQIKRFNCEHIDKVKTRLALLNTITIQRSPEDESDET